MKLVPFAALLVLMGVACPYQAMAASADVGSQNVRVGMAPGGVTSPAELIAFLKERGYAVDIVTRDADGNFLFRIGRLDGSEQFTLLVNGKDGTILSGPKQKPHYRTA